MVNLFRMAIVTTCGLLLLPATAWADEDSPDETRRARRVEVRIKKLSKQKNNEEPETSVTGQIILEGPDFTREYSLDDDDLPKDFPIRIKTLRGPNGVVVIDRSESSDVAEEPRFMIGLRCEAPGPALSSHLKLNRNSVMITHVVEGLPAHEAGLQVHDILQAVNGEALKNGAHLIQLVSESEGDEVEISGLRAGEVFTAKLSAEKIAPRDIAEATTDAGDVSDQLSGFDEIFNQHGGRRWIMAPAIRMNAASQIDIEQLIREARELALNPDKETDGADETQVHEDVQKDLQKQIKNIQRQLNQINKRIDNRE